MKLTYIFHSGFSLEFNDFIVIIDYFQDTDDSYVKKQLLQRNKPLYVLSTHSHHDHFSNEILEWKKTKSDIKYIFSKEILDSGLAKPNEATFLDRREEYKDKNLLVRAYGSTDLGGSFYIETENKKIFHAGDLNNWHWKDESTLEEVQEADFFYQQELSLVSKDIKELDLAIFPVDPRLGSDFAKGAEQFISTIKVKNLIPMHFSSDPTKVDIFAPIAKEHKTHYICLTKKGDSIII